MSRFFTRYFTSVLVFMFALPIGTLLFGGFGSGRVCGRRSGCNHLRHIHLHFLAQAEG